MRVLSAIAAIGAIGLGGPAWAGTIRCHTDPINNMVVCQDDYAPPITPQVQLPPAPTPGTYCGVVCLGLMWKRGHDAKKAAAQQQQLRDTVAAMVRDGQCRSAQATAIQGGDYELADYVSRACKDREN
jgi:hypothetical protein